MTERYLGVLFEYCSRCVGVETIDWQECLLRAHIRRANLHACGELSCIDWQL